MKTALVLRFPGTNCEKETLLWLADNLEVNAAVLDLGEHETLTPDTIAAIVVPGGFSYGDYLRAGAISARSPEMGFVAKMASQSVPVLGICNGFQILCESRLLDGVLVRNITKQHHHFPVTVSLDEQAFNKQSGASTWIPPFMGQEPLSLAYGVANSTGFELPMSCGMGRYIPNPRTPTPQVVLRYLDNANGSTGAIAGIVNESGNVLGMMPHPERASEELVGSDLGLLFLAGLSLNKKIPVKKHSPLAHFMKRLSLEETRA